MRHKKLNNVDSPCHPSPDYHFAQCVHKSIVLKTGCQPHWRYFTVDGVPTCDNLSMLQNYQRILFNITYNMDSEDVFQATNCLRPCTFLEYKVSVGQST